MYVGHKAYASTRIHALICRHVARQSRQDIYSISKLRKSCMSRQADMYIYVQTVRLAGRFAV